MTLIHQPVDTPTPAQLQAWHAAFRTDQAQATAAHLAELAEEAEAQRRAASTRASYAYWWGRFETWLEDPSNRTVARSWPATPLPVYLTVVGSPTGDDLLFSYLSEYVYGPEHPEAAAEWEEDGGPVSPNTLGVITSAITARLEDLCGRSFSPSTRLAARLAGMRRHCRDRYGRDRRAFPLLTEHVTAIARYLDEARDPLVLRDRVVLELTAMGLSAAEIARLGADAIRSPAPDISAASAEANERLWRDTGMVGRRTLIIPGQRRRGGRQDPPRLVPLEPASPLTAAIDAHLVHRCPEDAWLIDGLNTTNRRSQVRDILIALGQPIGWRPTGGAPPTSAQIVAMREGLAVLEDGEARRRRRDLAMLWIGYLTALRRSELLALDVGSLTNVSAPSRWLVHIARSKTDQNAVGVTLPVIGSDEHRGTALDPVHAIAMWLEDLAAVHGGTLTNSTPLFPALDRAGELMRHLGRTVERMSDQAWSDRLRNLAERSGAVTRAVDLARVSGHSLRRGLITQLAILGRTPLAIQQISRHKSLDQLAAYVESVQLAHGSGAVSANELLSALTLGRA